MVKNILLLDSEGKRVAVKYYSDDWPTNSAKLAFEKSLFAKTMKSNARTEGLHKFVKLFEKQSLRNYAALLFVDYHSCLMACIYDDWVVLTPFKNSFLGAFSYGGKSQCLFIMKKKTFLYCMRNANTDMHTGTDLCSIIYGRL